MDATTIAGLITALVVVGGFFIKIFSTSWKTPFSNMKEKMIEITTKQDNLIKDVDELKQDQKDLAKEMDDKVKDIVQKIDKLTDLMIQIIRHDRKTK